MFHNRSILSDLQWTLNQHITNEKLERIKRKNRESKIKDV